RSCAMFPTWNDITQIGRAIRQGFQQVTEWIFPEPAPSPTPDNSNQSSYSPPSSRTQTLGARVGRALSTVFSLPPWQESLLVQPSRAVEDQAFWIDLCLDAGMVIAFGPIAGGLVHRSPAPLARALREYFNHRDSGPSGPTSGNRESSPAPRVR